MKKGINRWCFPADWSACRCLEVAAQTSLDGVEFNLAEEGELTLQTWLQAWHDLAAKAHSLGLALPSISTALHWKYPLTANEAATRARGQEVVRRMVEAAAAVGADTVLVVPGLVTADVDYQTAYGRAQEALASLAPLAGEHGVVIGVENVWNKFLLSPLEFARFLDEIGSPWVRAYLDVGNVLVSGYPEQWIRILGQRIAKIHVKDFSMSVGNITGFVPLLAGDVPWPSVVAALRAVGYDGWLTAELAPYHHAPERLVYETAAALNRIIQVDK